MKLKLILDASLNLCIPLLQESMPKLFGTYRNSFPLPGILVVIINKETSKLCCRLFRTGPPCATVYCT
jgi:hypothetical protein